MHFCGRNQVQENMVRPMAWSKKDEHAKKDVEAVDIHLSILGCISAFELIAASQQVTKSSRKKKAPKKRCIL